MKRKLNVKLAIILGASTLTLAICVHLVHGWQVQGNSGALKKRAESLEKQDPREALKLYGRYLNLNPEDHETKFHRAKLALDIVDEPDRNDRSGEKRREDVRQAYSVLVNLFEEFSRDDSTELTEIRRRAARFAMQFALWNEAREHLSRLLRREPDNAELQFMMAQCQLRSGYRDEAIKILHGLIGYDNEKDEFDAERAKLPGEIDAYLLLGQTYRGELNNRMMAERVFEQLVANNPESHRAYLGRGQYYLGEANLEKARADIQRALELDPEDVTAIVASAQLAMADEKLDDAEALLERARKSHPDAESVYFGLMRLAALRNDPNKLKEYIVQGLAAIPESRILLWRRAQLELQEGDVKQVNETLRILTELGVATELLDQTRARLLMLDENYVEAMRLLARIRPLLHRFDALGQELMMQTDLLLAQCYAQLGMLDKQMESYELLLRANESSIEARLGLARSFEMLGRLDEAYEHYQKVAAALGRERFYSQAALWRGLLDLELRRQLILVEERRDWRRVEALLQNVAQHAEVDPVQLALARNEVLVRKEQWEEARQQLDQALAALPSDDADSAKRAMPLRIASIRLTARQKGADEALKELDTLGSPLTDSVIARITRAELLAMAAPDDVYDQLLKLEENVEDGDREALWQALTSVHAALQNYDDVKRLRGLLVQKRPYDLRTRLQMFEQALQLGDDQGVVESLREIEQLMGRESGVWAYCEAARLLQEAARSEQFDKLLVAVRQLLKQAEEERPSWHAPLRLKAEVARLEQNAEEATIALRAALKLGPADPQLVAAYVQLVTQRGDFEDARAALQRLADGQLGGDLRKVKIELEMSADREAGLAQAKRMILELERATAATAADYLWYGTVLAQAGQADAAETALRKACEKSPEDPRTWLSLVRHLALTRKYVAAYDAIREVEIALTEDQLPAVLAECYLATGKWKAAERLYREAIDTDPDNLNSYRAMAILHATRRDFEQAGKYLDQLLARASQHDRHEPHIVWARQEKARLLAGSGDYRNFLAARELLRQNYVDGQPGLADLSVEVELLTARQEFVHWEDAINKILEIRKQRKTLPTNLQLILARLHAQTGNHADSVKEMYDLASRERRNPMVLVTFIDLLMEQNQLNLAESWMEELEKVAPTSLDTIRRKALLLANRGRAQQAVTLLESQVPPAGDQMPDEQVNLVLVLATDLERIGEFDRAERLTRRYVALRPTHELALAQFLARRDVPAKLNEAMEICGRLVQIPGNVVPVLSVCLAASRSGSKHLTDEHRNLIEQWFEKAQREHPDSIDVRLRLAELRDNQNRAEEVIGIYREILGNASFGSRQNTQRAIVMNNLSYLLILNGGDMKEAEQHVSYAIDLLGPTSDLLDTRGMVYWRRGEFSKAIDDLRKAVVGRADATKMFHLALAYRGAGDFNAAHRTLAEARTTGLNPDALHRVERGWYDKLVADLEQNSGS